MNFQPTFFDLPDLSRPKTRFYFDEPAVTSDAGLPLLTAIEADLGIIRRMTKAIVDPRRDPTHTVDQLLCQRIFQIAAGSYDANDCDALRHDPVFCHLASKNPEEAAASQPTMTRFENSLTSKDLLNLAKAQVDVFMASYPVTPTAIVLDIDPTACLTYGQQELALFNTHVGDHCLMPFHIYEGQSGKIIATILRPGKTPTAAEIKTILKHLIRHLRSKWPETLYILRGDSHHTKPEVMQWMEANKVSYITGLSPNAVLKRLFDKAITAAKKKYQQCKQIPGWKGDKVVVFASDYYQASTWDQPRRVIARIYCGEEGIDERFIVTDFQEAGAKYLYETAYCGRGNAERFIKEHKLDMGSDRMSCTSAKANQFRLFLHNAAYALLHRLREKALAGTELATASLGQIRLKLLKIGARVKVMKSRLELHMSKQQPWKELFIHVVQLLGNKMIAPLQTQ